MTHAAKLQKQQAPHACILDVSASPDRPSPLLLNGVHAFLHCPLLLPQMVFELKAVLQLACRSHSQLYVCYTPPPQDMTEQMVSQMVFELKGSYKIQYHANGHDKEPVEIDFSPPWCVGASAIYCLFCLNVKGGCRGLWGAASSSVRYGVWPTLAHSPAQCFE